MFLIRITSLILIALSSIVPLCAEERIPAGGSRSVLSVTPRVAYRMLELNPGNQDIVILDVRSLKEYRENGRIEGSRLIEYRSPEYNVTIDSLDRSKIYLIHCAIGIRSGRTFELMKSLGFRRIFNIEGGIERWEREGFPVGRE